MDPPRFRIILLKVGHESFIIWIDEHRYIAVELTTVQGEVVSSVVRLMICSGDGDRILSPFDTAHLSIVALWIRKGISPSSPATR